MGMENNEVRNKATNKEILEMIESGNRPQKIKTLSPKGLQLVSVEY